MNKRILVVCTTDSMIWNFLIPHIKELEQSGFYVECASSITGDFYEKLVELHGIKMNEIPFIRSPYHIKNLQAYNALCKLLKDKHFFFYHVFQLFKETPEIRALGLTQQL